MKEVPPCAPSAVDVAPQDDYHILVTFADGAVKLFDVKPYLDHPAFLELKIPALFRAVRIGGLSVEWLRGQDICPEELYYNSVLVNGG